ncbi:regulatory protein RecX [Pseudoalteromonas ruthenica]|uniref:Regulatory protein RecX n=1 Tax=Pseudoalteromonas ruthenica TaxID=151081 RepID=A0A0F4PYT0_9GAMM|nr:regulatory protein RecX [Pseudoalteromonas ruthenica]KJY97129.1 peptidase [Pseudoalteromonas ruthenica]KJY99441.1 peptidase [Pseudoalteromonas ruthenica]TMO93482.1 regulatory protein RecX [Pseudoalteromonas ruthenica]TMO96360.1 regulatory protein RecX [Pseudoalteromonas ruthenica]TMP05023.1 regulatory protein RecX [Pseudoalteromonas ruthenica]
MDDSEKQKQKNYVLWLLGRQDYSRKELERKLSQRQVPQAFSCELLDWCEQHGFLDDNRFCAGFVRRAADKRHGPRRIMADAQQKGLAKEQVSEAIDALDIDWFELAIEAYTRKFRTTDKQLDYKEKAKRMRYLTARGFDYQQIEFALASEANDE